MVIFTTRFTPGNYPEKSKPRSGRRLDAVALGD